MAKNILSSTVEFVISPKFVIAELKKAEKEGLELIGFFHSHPAAAYPSAVDLKTMKLWPNTVWLIFSLTEKKFSAYLIRNNILEEIELKIES